MLVILLVLNIFCVLDITAHVFFFVIVKYILHIVLYIIYHIQFFILIPSIKQFKKHSIKCY